MKSPTQLQFENYCSSKSSTEYLVKLKKLNVQVIFNKLVNLSKPQFLILLNGNNIQYLGHDKGSYMVVVAVVTVVEREQQYLR